MIYLTILFWLFLFIVFYTYIGYGILLFLLVRLKRLFKGAVFRENKTLPEVTLFITAYNEENVINDKMENSLKLIYPDDLLNIVWVTDGSNDNTNALLKNKWKENAHVLYDKERKGKTAAINRGMKFITSSIVIYTDANTMLNKEAIIEIVKMFNDPSVGCVAGEKRIYDNSINDAVTDGEGLYWKYESTLKKLDFELYSSVGAAGELFAIRRELFEPMKDDTLLDDFILSLRIAMQGYIIAYCSSAYALEYGSANMREEEKRKVRIAAGGLQSIWRLRELLNIFKYKTLSFQYISHRVLRWSITPLLLFSLLPINLILAINNIYSVYTILMMLQISFYILAYSGYYMASKHMKNKILFIPYYFLFMNINVFKGIAYLWKRKNRENGIWEKSIRSSYN